MTIGNLRANHLENPLGFHMETVVLSWSVSDAFDAAAAARVWVSEDDSFADVCHDSGRSADISGLAYEVPLALKPRTRYHWRVRVWAKDGTEAQSDTAWFETGKMEEGWMGAWIGPPVGETRHPLFAKALKLEKPVARARVYASGLGVYELYVNGQKAGDEFLAPFYTDYNNWVQYQTYDVTELLRQGDNTLGAMVGNGWYKGRFGFVNELDKLYGDSFHFIAELHVTYADGTGETLGTDESWCWAPSPVVSSSIYDGEAYDARLEPAGWFSPSPDLTGFGPARLAPAGDFRLMARLSPPVTITERLGPPTLLRTPAGEDVLDFGQVLTGWVEFHCALPAGQAITLQHGELLQNGNFYTENLRTAKQLYHYTSNSEPRTIRPFHTFYGLRFVKVSGIDDVNPADFTACVVHSDLARTGTVETSDARVNRLIQNALWSQRGNFLDVPTDCPQRDERMGWTGDAQVFAPTASFVMETPAFYDKYLYDMLLEQRQGAGSVPHVVPDVLGQIGRMTGGLEVNGGPDMTPDGSCAWGDAATVIPWTMYLFYGDKAALARQYENMKLWADFMYAEDERDGGNRLWKTGFHFADWLALDNPSHGTFGRTDPYYVASCYYYYSTGLAARAASVLGRDEEAAAYASRAEEVRAAIVREYYTATGRLAIDTQTAHVLALYFGIVPDAYHARTARDLAALLDAADSHLNTGFVGTAYLCAALCDNGLAPYAYTLLLNDDYPSWLYEVKMGATTIWERWNSVLPSGLVSDTGMNSMNHYAYGAIVEWMYRYMCGLNPVAEAPGFAKARIAPMPDVRLAWAKASYHSAAGLYKSGWEETKEGYRFEVQVPFGAQAEFTAPGMPASLRVNGVEVGGEAVLLGPGNHTLTAAYPNGLSYA